MYIFDAAISWVIAIVGGIVVALLFFPIAADGIMTTFLLYSVAVFRMDKNPVSSLVIGIIAGLAIFFIERINKITTLIIGLPFSLLYAELIREFLRDNGVGTVVGWIAFVASTALFVWLRIKKVSTKD